MTTIVFHGLLAKKFGTKIKLHLGNLNFLHSAIDSLKPGFTNFIKQKEKDSQFYSISKKSKEKIIEIFPSIIGSGEPFSTTVLIVLAIIAAVGTTIAVIGAITKNPTLLRIGGYILQIVGLVLAFGAPWWVALIVGIMGSIATGYGDYLSAMEKLERMKAPQSDQQRLSSGGDASIVTAYGKTYVFSRMENLATQGSSVTIGYGKLKIGSKLISVSIKTTPSSYSLEEEIWTNDLSQIYG